LFAFYSTCYSIRCIVFKCALGALRLVKAKWLYVQRNKEAVRTISR